MVTLEDIRNIVGEVLQLGDRAANLTYDTPLLGGLPEFDSMAVVTILTRIEEDYGIIIDDDEVSAEMFETLGNLVDFMQASVGT